MAKIINIDIDYGDYFSGYTLGKVAVIPPEDFECFANRAKIFLGNILRGEQSAGFEKAIKDCLCEVAEKIYQDFKHGNIKNENIDGYSVSYIDSSDKRAQLFDIAIMYLGESGMLYAGVE